MPLVSKEKMESYAPQNTLIISKSQRSYTISYPFWTSCACFLLFSPTILNEARNGVCVVS